MAEHEKVPTPPPAPAARSGNAWLPWAVAAVFLLLGAFWWTRASGLSAEVESSKAAVAALTQEKATLGEQLAAAQTELTNYKSKAGELDQVQAKLEEATGALNKRLEVLGKSEQEVAAIETQVAAEKNTLKELQEQFADVGQRLNRRLTTLGDRERDSFMLDEKLEDLQEAAKSAEAKLEEVHAKLNQRLATLGEREQLLAAVTNEQIGKEYDLEKLNDQAKQVETQLQAWKSKLNEIDLATAKKLRELDEAQSRYTQANEKLTELRQLVSTITPSQ